MYKLILVSDTHGKKIKIEEIRDKEDADGILHLGDGVRDITQTDLSKYKDVHYVYGNWDKIEAENVLRLEIEGVEFIALHGNKFSIHRTLKKVLALLNEKNVNLLFYGHTHKQKMSKEGEKRLINPGHTKRGEYALVYFDKGSYKVEFKEI